MHLTHCHLTCLGTLWCSGVKFLPGADLGSASPLTTLISKEHVKLTQNQHLGATSPYSRGGGGSVVVVGILWWYAIFRVCFDQPLVRALSALGLLKLLNPDAC